MCCEQDCPARADQAVAGAPSSSSSSSATCLNPKSCDQKIAYRGASGHSAVSTDLRYSAPFSYRDAGGAPSGVPP